jgi:DNA invertase Pin-like site-specific DNA recombinase
MAIYKDTLNNYFNENYNEEKVKELLRGIKLPLADINSKIEFACGKFSLSTTDIKRCVFYGRVSTKTKEQASSIVNQHYIAEQFENEYMSGGFIVVEEVFERETATKASKRKQFMSLVERAKKANRDFDFIVVKAVDRMFRNVDDTIEIMKELRNVGVGLLFFYNGLNSLDPDDRNKIIEEANKAEEYSNKLSKNVKMGMSRHYKSGAGRFSSYAFGYDKPCVNNSSVVKINEEEAELIKELFNRYVYNNDNIGEIVVDWRSRGVKSKLNKEITTVGLRRMLMNRLYTGVLLNERQTRETVRDEWTAIPEEQWKVFIRPDLRIISDELFEAAQRRIEKEKFGPQHMLAVPKDRLFKSLIQCPVCGKNFYKHNNNRNSSGEHNEYFKCLSHKHKNRNAEVLECSNFSTFRKDEMLYVVSLYFKEMLENRDDIEELVRNSVKSILSKSVNKADKKDYSAEIKVLNDKYKRELNLYREGLVESTTELNKVKKELDKMKSLQAMENTKAELKYDVDEVMNKLFTSISELVETGMKEDTLDAVKFNSIFDSIIATPDNRLIFNLKASRVMTETFRNNGLDKNNDLCTFIFPTEIDVKKEHNSIYSEEQLKLLDKQRDKLVFVEIEKTFDFEKLYAIVNTLRNSSTEFRRRYRYSLRYRGLGRNIIDSVNIIL